MSAPGTVVFVPEFNSNLLYIQGLNREHEYLSSEYHSAARGSERKVTTEVKVTVNTNSQQQNLSGGAFEVYQVIKHH